MKYEVNVFNNYQQSIKKKRIILLILCVVLVVLFFLSLLFNRGGLSVKDSLLTLFGIEKGEASRLIIFNIRLSRSIGAVLIGFGLAISGLIMQINLRNPLASPSTLGVSNSALLGATISIIIFNNKSVYTSSMLSTTPMALLFAIISVIFLLFLSKIKNFTPSVVAVSGIAITSLASALTTIIQYFASDTQLASSVYFSFGDLSRTNYSTDLVLFIFILVSFLIFMFFSSKYNALYSGDEMAITLGVNINVVRLVSLFFASMICAITVSFVGVIGFIGILAPHIMKRFIGNESRYLIPCSGLLGAIILVFCDIISKVIIPNFALPVGAVTSIIGAPFFFFILISKKENIHG